MSPYSYAFQLEFKERLATSPWRPRTTRIALLPTTYLDVIEFNWPQKKTFKTPTLLQIQPIADVRHH